MTEAELAGLRAWFSSFVAGFVGETPDDQRNYDLKVEHTYRVCAIMDRLTSALDFSADERRLMAAIALCHDVGRFPQYRQWRTFNDPVSANHGTLAIQVLKREGALASLPEETASRLLQGVALHNLFELPAALTAETVRRANLIRDADKLDIWRVMLAFFQSTPDQRASAVVWELPDTGSCSDEVIREVAAGRVVHRSLLRSADDFKLLQLSWVYDLHFAASYQLFQEFGYYDTLVSLLPAQPGIAEAAEAVARFLDRKLNER